MKIKDITNNRYGKLIVLSYSHSNKRGDAIWLCKCDCGNKTSVKGSSLRFEKTKSCGCIIPGVKRGGKNPQKILLRSYKHFAKERNFSFELTEEQFLDLTSKNCYYCNLIPSSIKKGAFRSKRSEIDTYIYNGVDRVDTNKGYTIENTVPCCKYCNYAKNNRSVEDFYIWVNNIYNNLKNNKNVI